MGSKFSSVSPMFMSLLSVWVLAGCSGAKFSANKQEVLAGKSVFGSSSATVDGSGAAEGQIHQPGQSADPTPKQDDQSPSELRLPENGSPVPVTLYCSDSRMQNAGTTLKGAIARGEPLKLSVNQGVCATDATVIRNLALQDSVSVEDLRSICPSVVPPTGATMSLTAGGKNLILARGTSLGIVWAANRQATAPSPDAPDGNCDVQSSPLVIHRASDIEHPRAVELSSRADGLFFDLLGERNHHKKVRISWFTNEDYYMLALPTRGGEVLGIDELFGDNTRGPDGTFADHGYAALAKYDDNGDGQIDRRDRVFSRLRVWLDKNRDGVGQRDELQSLADIHLKSIDLIFTTQFAEMDQYGNETKMKSVVTYEDDSLDLIFDLWFRYRLN